MPRSQERNARARTSATGADRRSSQVYPTDRSEREPHQRTVDETLGVLLAFSGWPHDNALIALGLARYGRKRSIETLFEGVILRNLQLGQSSVDVRVWRSNDTVLLDTPRTDGDVRVSLV
jgi:hypothetical protein